jgi:serine/threonine protein kinase
MNMEKPDIPNFEFERCCGSGAYGDVWIARDMNGANKAIKVLYKTRLKNLGVLEKEIRGLKLYCNEVPRHPNLIEVFHAGETATTVYYVMEPADNANHSGVEYIPETLASKLQSENKLSTDETITLGWKILDAVAALHQAGVVHRDVKPDNIVYIDGNPKLADIGLITTNSKNITLAGTQGFMPPEGVDGTGADLYAVGKLLYCSMTGNDVREFPSLPNDIKRTSCVRKLNRIILRACSRKSSLRYQSAIDFQNALIEDFSTLLIMKNFFRKNAIALIALIIAVIALTTVFLIKCGDNEGAFPPPEIMKESNIFLPELDLSLIYLPSGQVMVQNSANEKKIAYPVVIKKHFWMGQYEVTQAQYEKIMGHNLSNFKGLKFPVENITWPDAIEFCQRVTEQERQKKRLPIGYVYRLPTEAEWFYAAQGASTQNNFAFSGNNNPNYYAWYIANSNDCTHQVGSKNPNKLGLYDMSGNVWELCSFNKEEKDNDTNHSKFYKDNMIIKGGSWNSEAYDATINTKYFCSADIKLNDIGFRIVLAPNIEKENL